MSIKAIVLQDGVTIMGEIKIGSRLNRPIATDLVVVNFIQEIDKQTQKPMVSTSMSAFPPLAKFGTQVPLEPKAFAFGPYKPEDRFIRAYKQAVEQIKRKSSIIQVVPSVPANLKQLH